MVGKIKECYNNRIFFEVVPKSVYFVFYLNYHSKFLSYIKNRYKAFVVENLSLSRVSYYNVVLNKKISICEECKDKEILVIPNFEFIKICFSLDKKLFCFFCYKNKYLFDSVLRVIYSIVLSKHKGFLLHSAGIIEKNGCLFYVGPTNSGKSTLAKNFSPKYILSDELCPVIVNKNNQVLCWKSPFYSEVKVEYGFINFLKLKKIYFLLGFSENKKILKLDKKEAFLLLLKNIFWIPKNQKLTQNVLTTAYKVIKYSTQNKLFLEVL